MPSPAGIITMKNRLRLVHTADWHLGYRLGRHHRRADTTRALESLIKHVETVEPDLILHAGDVFHDERPPQSAIEDAVNALRALADQAPVVICAGNHDGPRLLRSLDQLAREGRPQRITIATEPRVVRVEAGRPGWPQVEVAVAAVPWLSKAMGAAAWAVRKDQEGEDRPTHRAWAVGVVARTVRDAQRAVALAAAEAGTGPVVALLHTHLAGAVAAKSERLIAVGPDYAIDSADIPATDYCACGHIHDRQMVGRPADSDGRDGAHPVYCGSLTHMTFGEGSDPRTVEVVDLETVDEKTGRRWAVARRERLALARARTLVEVDGNWPELRDMAKAGVLKDSILKARVRTDERMHELSARITEIEPTVQIHEVINEVTNPSRVDAHEIEFEDIPEPGIDELYREWRRDRRTTERENDDEAVELLRTALDAAEDPSPDPFGIGRLERQFEEIMANLAEKQQCLSLTSAIPKRVQPTEPIAKEQ